MLPIVNYISTSDPFGISLKPVSRPVLSFREEILETAENIANSTTRPIVLGFSGGIDSEVIARAMLEKKVPFSVLTIRHAGGLNDHDIVYANKFCQHHNVKQQIVEIDIMDFFTQGINKYIEQGYHAVNLFRYFHLLVFEIIEAQSACGILGGGEPIFYNFNEEICMGYTQEQQVVLNWFQHHNTVHYPWFFIQNSELVASYLQEPFIQQWLTQDVSAFLKPNPAGTAPNNSGPDKIHVYHTDWPDMERRPKYTGYENIQPWRVQRQIELRDRFGKFGSAFLSVDTVKKQLKI
jgi:hypothetical protein